MGSRSLSLPGPGAGGPARQAWVWGVWLGLVALWLLVAARLGLFLGLQLPAPVGDGVLFASVAQYHCASGVAETPIFPLDPSGGIRYVWHGIGWPLLLSWLNPDCSLLGSHIALCLVMAATAGLIAWNHRRSLGGLNTLALALVVFALQSKLGFRPETLAMPLVLLVHALRRSERVWPAVWVLGGLAWVQPTVCLIAAAHALLVARRSDWWLLGRGAVWGLPVLAVLQGLAVLAYPFPVADLVQGLLLQGRQFSGRDDGSLFTYYLRSDFFPLLGLAMALVYARAVWRRPTLLGLLPAIVYFGLRVPPTFYNLVPLFVVLLAASLDEGEPRGRSALPTLWLCALLALAGLAQSVLRDGVTAWRDPGPASAALARAEAWQAQGGVVCGVPPWFTLLVPAPAFAPSYQARWAACDTAAPGPRIDLVPLALLPQRGDATGCERPPAARPLPGWLNALVRNGSGYRVVPCPAAAVEAAR